MLKNKINNPSFPRWCLRWNGEFQGVVQILEPTRICFLALALAACSDGTPTPAPAPLAPATEPARAVTVVTVELRPISGIAVATGLLVSREEAAVGSELSGFRVAEVLVEEGAIVRTGEPLARLDDTLLRARIAQARAALLQAQAQEAQAGGDAERVAGLEGTGVLSDEAIAQRRNDARSAEAGTAVAQAQLNDLTTQAGRMTIRAPVAGLVLERKVRPGDVASAGGDPMFRIARDRLVELDAEVAEDALAAIQIGSKVAVTLPAGIALQGAVRLISPRVDPQTKLGRVRVALPIDPALRPGGFARASFQRDVQPVPAVPERAVQFEASGPLLTVIGADNRAQRMPIRIGARAEGYVELLGGPPPGTRVALGGAAFLLEGDKVAPTTAATRPGAEP